MDNQKKLIFDSPRIQIIAILSLGLIFACYLQRTIQVRGVGSFWNLSLIPMLVYCALLYLLAWKAYSRFLSDLLGLDKTYVSKLDLYSYMPTLLLLQYFVLFDYIKVVFEQKLLALVFILICALKACQLIFLFTRKEHLSASAFIRPVTLVLLVLIFAATIIFIRLYDYALYKTIEPRLIVRPREKVIIQNEARKVLYSPSPYLPGANRLEKEATLPEDAMMSFGIAIARNSWFQSDTGVEFHILIDTGGVKKKVFSRLLDPKANPAERGWNDEMIDLSEFSSQSVTLVFETEVPYSRTASLKKILKSSFGYTRWTNIGKYGNIAEAVWSEPRIYRKGQEQGPNIILISFDTLSAPHMGCYGHRFDTTPNIDRFAADGVIFNHCIVQSTWTLPSHMSLLTGQNCSAHGVVTNAYRLDDSFVSLAEVLRDNGYQTAAITEGGNVASTFGFDQGFDLYDNGLEQDIDKTFAKVHDWLERKRTGKFFLFTHTYETHSFYDKREPYYSSYNKDYRGLIRGDHRFLAEPQREPHFFRPEDLEELSALYDSEIAYIDARFQELMDKLAVLGLDKSTIVVVTSDHGEGFGEHHYFGHGNTLYDELLLVPLIMKGPGLPGGIRVDKQARSTDIMPTLLDLVGLPAPENLDGVSLLPSVRGEAAIPPAVSEVDEPAYGPLKKSIRADDMKLILVEGAGEPEFYMLDHDPGEGANAINTDSEAPDKLQEQLIASLEVSNTNKVKITGREEGAQPVIMDESTREQLKALGYIE